MTFPDIDNQTIVACLLTPRGRGAVATIAVRGSLEQLSTIAEKSPHSFFLARNQKPLHLQTIGKILFGNWGEEELVVCRTSDDEFEIHCHGGEAAISRILSDLEKTGVSILNAFDYLEEAVDRWEADYQQVISRARTFQTATLLLQQRKIGIGIWKELEKCLDAGYWSALDEQAKQNHRVTIQQMQYWANFGKHLTAPWNIVIGGLANVGKSSLINALLGFERAIVVDQPGTTRDVVSGETALEGWPVIFSDTAGQRETQDNLETIGIEQAVKAMQKADLQILLLDRSIPPGRENQRLMESFPDALLVFNKTDLAAAAGWHHVEFLQSPLEVSCQTGEGIEQLITKAMQMLIPQSPPASLILPVSDLQQQVLNKLACLVD